jgi:CheY-like chemotaxis protein
VHGEESHVSVSAPVLVVENDGAIRGLVGLLLSDEGFVVHTAPDGAAALELVGAYTFSVILLDLQMPVMDGWAFVAAYRSRFTYHAPIVVVSAAPEAPALAERLGAEAQLSKPFDFDALLDTIRRVVRPTSEPTGVP